MATRRMLNSNRRTRLNCSGYEMTREEAAQILSERYPDNEVELILRALDDEGYDYETGVNRCEFYFYHGTDYADVAEQWLDETGAFNRENDWMKSYFDFERYGRDMSYEASFWFDPDSDTIIVIL